MPKLEELGLSAIASLDDITACRTLIAGIRLSPEIVAYVVDLVRATREHASLQYGASRAREHAGHSRRGPCGDRGA